MCLVVDYEADWQPLRSASGSVQGTTVAMKVWIELAPPASLMPPMPPPIA